MLPAGRRAPPDRSTTAPGMMHVRHHATTGIFRSRRAHVRRAPRVRVGRRGGHRRRGDLQRRARVPQAGVEERAHDARHHGLARSASCSSACRCSTAHMHVAPLRATARRRSSRRSASSSTAAASLGQHPLLLPAGRHDAHPRARREHELRRLPAPRVVPRRRQLHAPPAHQARAPARVLERHHLPRGRPPSCC